jgi:hypothetical protein
MPVLSQQKQDRLQDWLSEHGELFVDVYRPKSAGASTSYFIRQVADIEAIAAGETYPHIVITIFRAMQFALRGVAGGALLSQALEQIPDGRSFRVVPGDVYYPSSCLCLASGDSHKELRDVLLELSGERVGVGPDPLDNDDRNAKTYMVPCETVELVLTRKMGAYVFT